MRYNYYNVMKMKPPQAANATATATANDPPVVKPKANKSRIPVALQAVFLASNRGEEVHKPPPGRVANGIFRRLLFARRGGGGVGKHKNKGGVVEHSESTADESYETAPMTDVKSMDDSMHAGSFVAAQTAAGSATPTKKAIKVRFATRRGPSSQYLVEQQRVRIIAPHCTLTFYVFRNPCCTFFKPSSHHKRTWTP